MKSDYPPRVLRLVRHMDNVTLKNMLDSEFNVASYFKLFYFSEMHNLKNNSLDLIVHNLNDSDFYVEQNDSNITLNALGKIADSELETMHKSSYNVQIFTLRNILWQQISEKL